MKHNLMKVCALMACTAMIFASCQKEDEPVEGKTLTLAFQTPKSNDSKVYINASNYPAWESGDHVYINGQNVTIRTVNDDGSASVTVNNVDAPYVACYPYFNIQGSVIGNGYTVPISNTQTYEGTVSQQKVEAPMVAYLEGAGTTLQFKNTYSLLKFQVTAPDDSYTNLTQIKVTNLGTNNIAGEYNVDLSTGELTGSGSYNAVTLTNGTVELNCSTEKTVYLYLAPVRAKLKLELTFSNGTDTKTYERSMANESAFVRSTYYSVSANASTSSWTEETEAAVDPTFLPGVFSVSSTKKVKFTTGNLYYDGSAFQIEANQTDYPTTWNTNHVGHFFWTKTAAASYAQNYSDGTNTTSDQFFADGSDAAHMLTVGTIGNLYCLSKAEWQYLFETRRSPNNSNGENGLLYKRSVTVTNDGTSYAQCLIIAPDGYTGTFQSSYTLDEVNNLGFVCIPAAGEWADGRGSSSFVGTGSISLTSTPYDGNINNCYLNLFTANGAWRCTNDPRSVARPIRLVQTYQANSKRIR